MSHKVELYQTDEGNFKWRRVDVEDILIIESKYEYPKRADALKDAMDKNPGLIIMGDVEE